MSCLIVLFLDCKNDLFPISEHDCCMRLLFWLALVIAVKAKPYGELKLILQNYQILKSWRGSLILPSSTSQARTRSCYYILSAEPISDQVLDISCVETTQQLWVPPLAVQHLLERKVRNFCNISSHSKDAPDIQICASSLCLQRGKVMEEMTFFFSFLSP